MRLAGVEGREAGVDEGVVAAAWVEAGAAGVDWGAEAAAALAPNRTDWSWKKTAPSLSDSACAHR